MKFGLIQARKVLAAKPDMPADHISSAMVFMEVLGVKNVVADQVASTRKEIEKQLDGLKALLTNVTKMVQNINEWKKTQVDKITSWVSARLDSVDQKESQDKGLTNITADLKINVLEEKVNKIDKGRTEKIENIGVKADRERLAVNATKNKKISEASSNALLRSIQLSEEENIAKQRAETLNKEMTELDALAKKFC